MTNRISEHFKEPDNAAPRQAPDVATACANTLVPGLPAVGGLILIGYKTADQRKLSYSTGFGKRPNLVDGQIMLALLLQEWNSRAYELAQHCGLDPDQLVSEIGEMARRMSMGEQP